MRNDGFGGLADDLRGLPQRLEQNLRAAVRMAGEEAANVARHTTVFRDRSAVLRNSIAVDGPTGSFAGGDLEATLSAGASYASFVEDGTRPHTIRPRDAKVLRWPVEGGFTFARVVHHPGTEPRPFLNPAVDAAMGRLHDKLIPDAIELSFVQVGFSPG